MALSAAVRLGPYKVVTLIDAQAVRAGREGLPSRAPYLPQGRAKKLLRGAGIGPSIIGDGEARNHLRAPRGRRRLTRNLSPGNVAARGPGRVGAAAG